MLRIINESLQDVSDYLRSSDLKEEVRLEYPSVVNNPASIEDEVNHYIVSLVEDRFPNEPIPEIVSVVVIKIIGDISEVLSSDHQVIEFNGTFYDYTAHQYSDSYNSQITYSQSIPVTQQVVTNDRQLNDGISSVKGYALLKI